MRAPTTAFLLLAACGTPAPAPDLVLSAPKAASLAAAMPIPNLVERVLESVLPTRGGYRVRWGPRPQPSDAPLAVPPWGPPPTVNVPVRLAFTAGQLNRNGTCRAWPCTLLIGDAEPQPVDLAPFHAPGYWLLVRPKWLVPVADGDVGLVSYVGGVVQAVATPPGPCEFWVQAVFQTPAGPRLSGAVMIRVGS